MNVEKAQLLARHPGFVAHPYFRLKHQAHANASIPARRYAVAYTNGYYGETDHIYERLFDYIETYRLQIAGDAYEDCLTDEIVHKNPEEYLMRVSICVRQP